MAGTNFSRQREAILTYLHSTTAHPTAETVYQEVRKTYPKISLGTVYRNLNLLADSGEALRLNCGDGYERFDGNPKPHFHFYCRKCGQVMDLDIAELSTMNELAAQLFDGSIEGSLTYFYGVCPDCKQGNSNN